MSSVPSKIEYNKYLKRHINAVNICYKLLTGRSLRGHDLSKYGKEEYEQYCDHFYPEGDLTKEGELRYDEAWNHHIHNNPHHWNYWVTVEGYKPDGEVDIVVLEMPLRYVYEMVADWGAFALIKKDPKDIIKFYESHKNKIILHKVTRRLVEKLIKTMSTRIEQFLKHKEL